MGAPAFRFDADEHIYTDLDGRQIPNITTMLKTTGWIDERWYTEESCLRGIAVHSLTTDVDLGALDVESCVTKYRGYLLAHVAATKVLRPTWTEIEVPRVHEGFRFGGRPDRVGLVCNLHTIADIKSGAKHKAHPIQTALQAILVATPARLPAHQWQRMNIYIKATGKFCVEIHRNRRDFDEAMEIIKACC